MKSRQHLTPNKITRLNPDVLLSICLFMDMCTVLVMKVVSRHSNKKISELMKKDYFWLAMSQIYFSNKQIVYDSKQPLDKLYKSHLSPTKTLISHLENNLYFKPCKSVMSFFSTKNLYTNQMEIEFDLSEIKSYIINDDASELFSAVSRLGEALPLIKDDYSTPKTLVTLYRKITLGTQDLAFIGLIPGIITFRAIQCFDLFIQAYFKLILAFPITTSQKNYTVSHVFEMVLNSKENEFIQRFIFMIMKLSIDNPVLHKEIVLIADMNNADSIKFAFNQLSFQEQDALLKNYNRSGMGISLIKILDFRDDQQRYKLISTLKSAIDILESNNTLNINTLLLLRENTQSMFAKLIDLLSNQQFESMDNSPTGFNP